MAMFGRDSILTSLQALPFAPELAATTLRALADWQGTRVDDFRDEDPGRILHEMRYGETAAFEEQPHSPYYGNADATPLFVVLLDEYERWTGDTQAGAGAGVRGPGGAGLDRRVRRPAGQRLHLVPAAQRRHRPGEPVLEGLLGLHLLLATAGCPASRGPPASCRATRTTRRCAAPGWPGRSGGTRPTPTSWSRQAAELKRAVQPGLLAARRRVLRARPGRRRDQGGRAVLQHRAPAVERHRRPDQGQGGRPAPDGPAAVLRLGRADAGRGEGRFNPIGYHIGTVWPFDNSFIAWGLRRYGFKDEAARIAAGILDAAEFFDGRLPEAFGGYERGLTKYPVQYPTACSPQAWSTGAPLLLLRTMLGLEPVGDHLGVDPALPKEIGQLALLDIPGGGATSTRSAAAGSTSRPEGVAADRVAPGAGPRAVGGPFGTSDSGLRASSSAASSGRGGGAAEVGRQPPAIVRRRPVRRGSPAGPASTSADIRRCSSAATASPLSRRPGCNGSPAEIGDRHVALGQPARPALGPQPLGSPHRHRDQRHAGRGGHPHRAALDLLDGERPADRRLREDADHLAVLERLQGLLVRGEPGVAVDRDVVHAPHQRPGDRWSKTDFLAMKRTSRRAGGRRIRRR